MATWYANDGEHEGAVNVCILREVETHDRCIVDRDELLGGGLSNRRQCVARKNPEPWKHIFEIVPGPDLRHSAPTGFENRDSKHRSRCGSRPGSVNDVGMDACVAVTEAGS